MADQKQNPQAPKVEKVNSNNGKKVEEKKQVTTAQSSTQKTMFEKTQPQTSKDESSSWLKILALGALIFGLVVLLAILILVVVTRISPRVDSSLPVPALKDLPKYTNADKIKVEGVVKDAPQVIIYVQDPAESKIVDVDAEGNFSYEYTFSTEKKYVFEAAGLSGAIVKSRSEKSASVETTYDKTAPSANVTFDNLKTTVNTDKITLKGKAEADTTVTIKNGDKSYEAKTDKDGNFEIKDVVLSKGENTLTVEVKDAAGNVARAQDLKITYTSGSLNGGGVTTGPDLPNSAGPLEDALAAIGLNNFLFGFGLFALILLVVNGSIVAVKLKRQ